MAFGLNVFSPSFLALFVGGDHKLRYLRSFLPLAFFAAFGAAQAQTVFSAISASYTLNPGAVTRNWTVAQNQPPMTIDFIGNAPAFKVGAGTSFSTGTSTITYNVVSSVALS